MQMVMHLMEDLVSTIKQRKVVTMSTELATRIDDYRFEKRFPTETDALRSLIEAGLRAEATRTEPAHAGA